LWGQPDLEEEELFLPGIVLRVGLLERKRIG
jgi:hypothetical protein